MLDYNESVYETTTSYDAVGELYNNSDYETSLFDVIGEFYNNSDYGTMSLFDAVGEFFNNSDYETTSLYDAIGGFFNTSDYVTTTLNDAVGVFYNTNEEQINDITTAAPATWETYDVCHPSAYPEEFLTCSAYHSFIYLMYTIIFLVSLIGNGLVCFVVYSSPQLRTVTNYFMVNLSVGDIVMTLFCVPFSSLPTLIIKYWTFGAAMCKIMRFTQATTVFISAYTMLSISIDRYITIMWPLRPRMRKATAKMVIAAVWLGACATAAPILVVSDIVKYEDHDFCTEVWNNNEQQGQYSWALLILQFVLPLSVMACTYARIALVVWVRQPPGEAQDTRDLQMKKSKRKVIKMMMIVVAAFTMSWLPINIYNLLLSAYREEDLGFPYTWFLCHWFAMTHSCYNPIIYCYMNNQYREGFKKALRWVFRIRRNTSSRHEI